MKKTKTIAFIIAILVFSIYANTISASEIIKKAENINSIAVEKTKLLEKIGNAEPASVPVAVLGAVFGLATWLPAAIICIGISIPAGLIAFISMLTITMNPITSVLTGILVTLELIGTGLLWPAVCFVASLYAY